jgi:predicted alpha/beta hydrolase family esterase
MRVSDFDLILAPRLGGPSADDWQRRWAAKLSTARFATPADPSSPGREAWIEALATAARGATRPILFVGHGLGAIAIAEAAGALRGADMRGAFLAAPTDARTLVRLGGGWREPSRAPLPFPSLVVASRGDPESEFSAILGLAVAWGSQFIDAGEVGGLDAMSGHGPWPDGLLRLAAFIKTIGAPN